MTSTRTSRAISAAVIALALLAAAAHADETEKERKARAYALLKEGRARYDLGKFKQAIDLFERAYDVWPYPETLFNLGQAHRQLKNNERAVFFFRSYIRNKPDAENRAEVEAIIAELEALIRVQKESTEKPPDGTQEPASQPASAPAAAVHADPKAAEREAWYRDTWGWAIAGGGLLTAGVGVGFIVNAASLDDQADNETDLELARSLRDKADTRRVIGLSVAAGGAICLGLGVVKLAWPSESQPSARRAGVVFGPGWVAVRGRF